MRDFPAPARRSLAALSFSLLLDAGSAVAAAPAPPPAEAIQVRGEVSAPGPLTVAELQKLGAISATWTVHGKSRTVVGVPLAKALERFGVVPGPMSKEMAPADKRPGYKKAIVASAADGFQAVFSLAEVTEGMGKTQALLVWQLDGQPLPAEQRPLRLIVLSDGEPSRSIYRLQRLDVVDLRKLGPAAAGKPQPGVQKP